MKAKGHKSLLYLRTMVHRNWDDDPEPVIPIVMLIVIGIIIVASFFA